MAKKTEPRIVSAAGIASASTLSGDVDLSTKIQTAMSDAVTQAIADGITDPMEHRKLITAAKEKVIAEAEAEAAAKAAEEE